MEIELALIEAEYEADQVLETKVRVFEQVLGLRPFLSGQLVVERAMDVPDAAVIGLGGQALGVVQLLRCARLVEGKIPLTKADLVAEPDRADHQAMALVQWVAKEESARQLAGDGAPLHFGFQGSLGIGRDEDDRGIRGHGVVCSFSVKGWFLRELPAHIRCPWLSLRVPHYF